MHECAAAVEVPHGGLIEGQLGESQTAAFSAGRNHESKSYILLLSNTNRNADQHILFPPAMLKDVPKTSTDCYATKELEFCSDKRIRQIAWELVGDHIRYIILIFSDHMSRNKQDVVP